MKKKMFLILLSILSILVLPTKSFAVVQSLNGETGQDQTFVNDTNIIIDSDSDTHAINWDGLLAPERGGTGVDLSGFTTDSILSWDGSEVSEWAGFLSPLLGGTGVDLSAFSLDSILSWNGSEVVEWAGLLSPTLGGTGVDLSGFTTDSILSWDGSEVSEWAGFLSPSNGGTGVDLSGFTPGSILFWNGSEIAENNSDLYWDNSNGELGLRKGITFPELESGIIRVEDRTSSYLSGQGLDIAVESGNGYGSGRGGDAHLNAGNGGTGGASQIRGGDGVVGGDVELYGGNGSGTNSSGGNVVVNPGAGNGSGNGGDFVINLGPRGATGSSGRFMIGITPYVFPGVPGTIALLEQNQSFTGENGFQGITSFNEVANFYNPVNNFISNSDSTVHIGQDGIPGCIVMGDDDSSGVTYITANDGVLSASSTPPANCN